MAKSGNIWQVARHGNAPPRVPTEGIPRLPKTTVRQLLFAATTSSAAAVHGTDCPRAEVVEPQALS
jgi:hypothetical protein